MGLFGSDNGLLGGVGSFLFGGTTDAEKKLKEMSTAYYGGSQLQRMLPPALRAGITNPILGAGIQGIGDLIAHPGGLSPTVSDAIRPQLGLESQSIAQNFQNLQQQSAGNAARGNAPVSIKGALSNALDVNQERAMREARMGALSQSDQLRRQDLEQTYKLLDMILQFISSGRGQGISGLGAASQTAQQRQAENERFTSALIQSMVSAKTGGMAGGMGGK